MRLTKPISTLFITLFFTLLGSVGMALAAPDAVPFEIPMRAYQTESGGTIVTLTIEMGKDWYTYSNDPGGMSKPTQLSATDANGMPLSVVYPKGVRKPDAYDPSVMVNKYFSGTRLFVVVPANATYPLNMRIDLLLCHPTKCVPLRRNLIYAEQVLDSAGRPSAEAQTWWPQFISLTPADSSLSSVDEVQQDNPTYSDWEFKPTYLQPALEVRGLLSAILMGLLAGLILNIMPCVLPVISLKLSAILNSSAITNEEDRIHAFREHNLFFVLGVLAFFSILAIVLGATGQAWGALFQKQWLVLGIAGIIIILSLSLFGLFHLPVIDLKFGSDSKNPRVQAFFTGNLTTLLATPCSGPFLGGVLSWALVQGPAVIAAVFLSIGLGMSLPYLLMTINPRLSRFLPKSGPWIEFVEKGIAFFLVGTAFYLVSIALGSHTLRFLAPLWAILLGGWLWARTRGEHISTLRRWTVGAASILLVLLTLAWTTPVTVEENIWEPFDAAVLMQRVENGPVFLDFTADWCPTCKVLEATVLTPENVLRWKNKYEVTFIKVDMTERDLEAEELLKALGSMSVPTAAFFTPHTQHEPLVLRDLFTKTQLENVLRSWKK